MGLAYEEISQELKTWSTTERWLAIPSVKCTEGSRAVSPGYMRRRMEVSGRLDFKNQIYNSKSLQIC